jgi:hypothetical protein
MALIDSAKACHLWLSFDRDQSYEGMFKAPPLPSECLFSLIAAPVVKARHWFSAWRKSGLEFA